MSDPEGFSEALAHADDKTETDLAVTVAWFICECFGSEPTTSDVIAFLEKRGIRHNVNKSRLAKKLQQDKRTSAPKGKPISIKPSNKREFAQKYAEFLQTPAPKIENNLLQESDFTTSRRYILEIVRQINGTYQFGFFDACAVMMRRLAEVLIIDAYTSKSADKEIRGADGHLVMMKGLVSALMSGKTFKLSRNAPAYLDLLKILGDNAAHSRNYITKKKDIDDFSQKFRVLIDELLALS